MSLRRKNGSPDYRRKNNGSQAKRVGARKAANTRRINRRK